MRNPLRKRYIRELRTDFGKYIALFLFLCLTIGFCSGFLVADGSTKHAYDDSFLKYSVESGHFTLAQPADEALVKLVEREADVFVNELFYKDRELRDEHTIRLYKLRTRVNRVDLMQGALPAADGEIAIDRLYAENNEITVGDRLTVGDMDFTVCGLVALSDYSALFKNNTDMMFDANKFTVALVTDADFDALGDAGLHYCYAWRNHEQNLSETEQKEKSDEILQLLAQTAVLTDFVSRLDNQAIMFTGDDMGGDKVMIEWLLYIVMAILAFVFAITTRSTMEQEASAIGTLRASGYTRAELLRHYLVLPLSVTLIAAVVGNVLGYTVMKNVVVDLYYHSYSLPSYTTVWNAEAFVLTTVIPLVIILVVNLLVLTYTLSLTPLQFLRHDLKRRTKQRVMRLHHGRFLSRFRCRVILQNLPAYVTMFLGIFFASVLLMFGMMFSPLLEHFKAEVLDSKIAEYQYILKAPLSTGTEGAEQYSVTALQNDSEEEITVYGVLEDSAYVKNIRRLDGDRVLLSDGYMDKYGIEIGDTITLYEQYGDQSYTFTVGGSYYYPAALSIFMPQEQFNSVFDRDADDFDGYFSNRKIQDIEDVYIATTITEHDLTVMADQLNDSMGMMFPMFGGFAMLLYLLMIYLLARLIVEKNAQSISMLKILGYSDRETDRLYNTATAIVVLISILASIPLSALLIHVIYYIMMQDFAGWLTYYIAPWIYPVMFVIGVVCYLLVHWLQLRKIRRIPMSQALKNIE